MEEFILALPKVELHVHIEGTLQPEQQIEFMKQNIQREKQSQQQNGVNNVNRINNNTINNCIIPSDADELRAKYKFKSLQEFLDLYYNGCNSIQTKEQFYELTKAYLIDAIQQNIVYVELMVDPQSHTQRGIALTTVLDGINKACDELQDEISCKLIISILRHLSVQDANEMLNEMIHYIRMNHDHHRIIAIGLDSTELNNPPEKFKIIFDRVRKELKDIYITIHAGEEGPSDYITNALNLCNANRIDHGIRCIEDKELVNRLIQDQIPLTICPLSNVKLCTVKSLEQHPIKQMLQQGLLVSINSDDPAYFNGNLIKNYIKTINALQLTKQNIIQLIHNSITSSFLTEQDKNMLHNKINTIVKKNKFQ